MTDNKQPPPSADDPELQKMLERMRQARQRDHEALVANTLPSSDDGGPWRPEPHGYLDIGGSPSGSVHVTITVPVTKLSPVGEDDPITAQSDETDTPPVTPAKRSLKEVIEENLKSLSRFGRDIPLEEYYPYEAGLIPYDDEVDMEHPDVSRDAPPPPPDLDPEQALRKRLSADLLELTLEDERRFEEREDQQRLDEVAENFERSLGDHDD